MSSPWTSPDPTQSDNQAGQEAHSSQPSYASPAAGTAYTAPGTQPGYTAPGPGPGYTAPGTQPGYTAAANSAPDASGYSHADRHVRRGARKRRTRRGSILWLVLDGRHSVRSAGDCRFSG